MRIPSRSFVFAPSFNDPPGEANPHGNDATGAFQPGLRAYRRFVAAGGGSTVECLFNNHNRPESRIRREIYDAMRLGAGSGRYDAIVYFGHGFEVGLSSAKINDRGPLRDFADVIRETSNPGVAVLLYACWCAADGGAAYTISERLRPWTHQGMFVMGHRLKGHSFRNPAVRFFPNGGAVVGRSAAPAGLFASWQKAMGNPHNDLWLRFPFMSREELRAEFVTEGEAVA